VNLLGLHEVAREIESPFQNVPNDVPLNNFQAQFNEGLMVMFYGYHPDAYWDVDATMQEIKESANGAGDGSGGTDGTQYPSRIDSAADVTHNATSNAKSGNATDNATGPDTAKKPAPTAFNPTPPLVATDSVAKPESSTSDLNSKPSTLQKDGRPLHSRKPPVTKIRFDEENDDDDEIPAIEAFMASLSQSGSFPSTCSPPPPSTNNGMQRDEEFAGPSAVVDEEREEYDNLGGNTRTLSADQMDLLEAKERQQRLLEAQQLQQQQQQKGDKDKDDVAKLLAISTTTSSDSSVRLKPPSSFLIPKNDGEDSSLVFFKGVDDGSLGFNSRDGSIDTADFENEENEEQHIR
jgi:hypothetical protein